MFLPDVNILVYAHREDSVFHAAAHAWLENSLNGSNPVRLYAPTLASFLRIVTNPRIFKTPTPLSKALSFLDIVRSGSAASSISEGANHWAIFEQLSRDIQASGNSIPDVYLAALAIEYDCVLITTDKGFGRFSSLRWDRPF